MNEDPLLILCAMSEEAAPFLENLKPAAVELPSLPTGFRGPLTFHGGTLEGIPVIVAETGIGMTNSALATTVAITEVPVGAVIFAGTTGGLGVTVRLGDVIVSEAALYHDADASDFGYLPGQIPRMPVEYEASRELRSRTESALRAAGIPFHAGKISASNSFISGDKVTSVRTAFRTVLAADMETTAGAQVCWSYRIPWISLRSVSDLCDPNAGEVFDEAAPDAYQQSFHAVTALLSSLRQAGGDGSLWSKLES